MHSYYIGERLEFEEGYEFWLVNAFSIWNLQLADNFKVFDYQIFQQELLVSILYQTWY